MKRGTPDHPKMLMLASLLGLEKWGAVGVMESVWHFTAKYAPAGDIGKYTDEMIAVGIGWSKSAEQLISALVESKWLEMSGQVRLYVHDWHHHSDDYADKHLMRNGLAYANGEKPRRQPAQNTTKGVKRRTKAEKSRGSVSVSVSESVSVSLPREGDSVYQILVEVPSLSGMSYEQDLAARRAAGFAIRDEKLMGLACEAARDAVIMGDLDHPAAWWRKFLEKSQSASLVQNSQKKESPPPKHIDLVNEEAKP